jgi:hypothetical protein
MQFVIHGLAFLGGAGVFVLLIIGVSMVITELLEHRRAAIIRYESYRFKQHIRIAAHFFSEDPPTMQLLLGLAEDKNGEELQKAGLRPGKSRHRRLSMSKPARGLLVRRALSTVKTAWATLCSIGACGLSVTAGTCSSYAAPAPPL